MIDGHQHFWRIDRGDYGWLTQALGSIYRDYLPEHLAPHLARHDISATILVQAAPTVAETQYLLDLARGNSFIAGVVGWVDFAAPDAAAAINTLCADDKLVGLRPMIQDIPDTEWMLEEKLAGAFEAMVDHDLVFDALVKAEHLPALRELIARYPDLRMVLDHGAKPQFSGDLADWKRETAALASESGIVCKLSGLVTEAGSTDPGVMRGCVEHLLEHFGARRMMWGSDWPVCELVCSYDAWRAASDTLLSQLDETARGQIYSEVARDTYGI